MIHGALKALRTHGHHSTTPHPGSWSFRAGRSRLKPRQAQRYRCSLIYKLPILRMLGASARYSRLCVPVETSTPPRRGKVRSAPFPAKAENCAPLPCPSFSPPDPLRWAPAGAPLRQSPLRSFAPLFRGRPVWPWALGWSALQYSTNGGRIVLRFGDIFSPPLG